MNSRVRLLGSSRRAVLVPHAVAAKRRRRSPPLAASCMYIRRQHPHATLLITMGMYVRHVVNAAAVPAGRERYREGARDQRTGARACQWGAMEVIILWFFGRPAAPFVY